MKDLFNKHFFRFALGFLGIILLSFAIIVVTQLVADRQPASDIPPPNVTAGSSTPSATSAK